MKVVMIVLVGDFLIDEAVDEEIELLLERDDSVLRVAVLVLERCLLILLGFLILSTSRGSLDISSKELDVDFYRGFASESKNRCNDKTATSKGFSLT
jgi:hypothetical protein